MRSLEQVKESLNEAMDADKLSRSIGMIQMKNDGNWYSDKQKNFLSKEISQLPQHHDGSYIFDVKRNKLFMVQFDDQGITVVKTATMKTGKEKILFIRNEETLNIRQYTRDYNNGVAEYKHKKEAMEIKQNIELLINSADGIAVSNGNFLPSHRIDLLQKHEIAKHPDSSTAVGLGLELTKKLGDKFYTTQSKYRSAVSSFDVNAAVYNNNESRLTQYYKEMVTYSKQIEAIISEYTDMWDSIIKKYSTK